ncbi:MAG: HAD-IIB family hydrolase [Gammaproteobacteria bacterium]|nr:HAD-IIB family hydrolase [Gammaproteobacteria bacterium]
MADQLLICTDLDRTLIPNGPQPESPGARERFHRLAQRPEVVLAYVSGRDHGLVRKAVSNYHLPIPDFVIGDVGTTIYRVEANGDWRQQEGWATQIAKDWAGRSRADIRAMLLDLHALRAQEGSKQNAFKLSFYVPLQSDRVALTRQIDERLQQQGIAARQIWSVDEPAGIGLLDILPATASKYHAIEALMQQQHFDEFNTVFCGDSGNDLEVLASPLKAVLVANAQPEVRRQVLQMASEGGHPDRIYIARGGYHGMNGFYSAGMLEGIAHYFPAIEAWLDG